MKKLYLVDVSSMFFRAFYAIRPLTSPAGVPVNAVYGFLSMVAKLLKDEKPECMVFCNDRKEASFRKDMYDAYKANRTEMPDDLQVQMPYIKQVAGLLGIPDIDRLGFEADDLIGTLAVKAAQQGADVVIVSGDKDFAQLVNEKITLYDTMKDVRYNPAGVEAKWGIPPQKMIDYLAIVGDSSDNVPGVRGIGEKGALKLLQQYDSLEDIYKNIDKIEPKGIKEKLIASKDQAFLSKKLVTIVTDMDVPTSEDFCRMKPFDKEKLRAFLQELNFKTFEKNLLGLDAERIGEAGVAAIVPTSPASTMTLSEEVVIAEALSAAKLVKAVDASKPVWGMSDDRGVFILQDGKVFALEGDQKLLGPLADQMDWKWKGFDLKTLWHQVGCENPFAEWDSMLAAYSVQASDCTEIEKVLQTYLGLSLPEMASPSQWLQTQEELEKVLREKLREREVESVYSSLEIPLAPVLLRMEKRGIRIDLGILSKMSEGLSEEIATVEKEVHRIAGESFNVGSPKQLGVILFEKLGLEATKKTKTGYSTDTDVLEKLNHPIAAKVLLWRELSKLKSTYVDALPTYADSDNRVHTHFDQALTATGRLSSTQPNLQNIPVRTARGQLVRKAFIAKSGCKLLSIDYSQIELRILAHISEDPGLTRAFADDLDIHAATAAEVFGISLDSVSSEQRRVAKAVNFGIAYGQGAFGLAEALGIPRGEAQTIIKRYFEKFRGVQDYIESTVKLAHEKGYVETLFGRRRYIDELKAKNPALKKFGERAAINAPIQGTASDLVKKAMIAVSEKIEIDMLLQVHDELIFEGTENDLREKAPQILSIMENVAKLKVPLKANHAIGDNWDEAH